MGADHEPFAAQAAAYALGALPPDEHAGFVAHLGTCTDCQRGIASLSRVVEALPQTLEPATLPPALKARVLAAATRPTPDGRPEAASAVRRDTRAWPGWLAAAACIVAVAAGAVAWSGWSEAARLRGMLAAAQAREAALDRQLTALARSAEQARHATAVLRASDLARVDLAGLAGAPVVSGRVLWSASQGLVFVAANLPALPPGRVYQLWVVAEKPLSAGIVVPDAAGELSIVTREAVAVRPTRFALTQEPEGGRPAPTGPMLLVGSTE